MFGLEADTFIASKDAAPLVLCPIKQAVDFVVEFAGGLAVDAEMNLAIARAVICRCPFVIEFGVNQFEDFIKGIVNAFRVWFLPTFDSTTSSCYVVVARQTIQQRGRRDTNIP